MIQCNKCYREGEYPFQEQSLCLEHKEEADRIQRENDRINAHDDELEERRR